MFTNISNLNHMCIKSHDPNFHQSYLIWKTWTRELNDVWPHLLACTSTIAWLKFQAIKRKKKKIQAIFVPRLKLNTWGMKTVSCGYVCLSLRHSGNLILSAHRLEYTALLCLCKEHDFFNTCNIRLKTVHTVEPVPPSPESSEVRINTK